jgi:intracellular sulfur oxidation DsrE/DsrF family protein
MKKRTKSTILAFVFLAGLISTTAASFAVQEDNALDGLKSIKAIIDFRIGDMKATALFLGAIHETYKSNDIAAVTEKPDFRVVFIGPATKLVTNVREGVSPEDQKVLDAIRDRISAMAKDGIKLEICLFAARLFNVDPATVYSDIKQVDNGVISLIGYQAKGFSLVPLY